MLQTVLPPPRGPSCKASASRAADQGSIPAFPEEFFFSQIELYQLFQNCLSSGPGLFVCLFVSLVVCFGWLLGCLFCLVVCFGWLLGCVLAGCLVVCFGWLLGCVCFG